MTTLDFLKCCLPPPSTAQGSHTRFHVNYYCEVHDCSKRLKDESLNKFSRIWSSRVTLIQAWVAKKYSLSSDSCVQNDLLHFPCQHLRLSPCEGTKKQSRVSSIFFAAAGSSEYAKSFLESHSQVGNRKAVAYDSLQPEEPGFIHRTIKIFKVLKLKLQSFFDAFIIDRYLFREMVPPFLAALAVCSTLGMSLGALVSLVREAVISGVPLRIAVAASFLQLPRFLSQMMPVACMAAVLFSFTRFQGDKELLALYSVGIPMWRLLFAPLCLGMLAGVLKLACHEYLVPFSNGRAQESGGIEATKKRLQRVWYAKRCDGGRMLGVLVLDISRCGEVRRVLIADACNWFPKEKTWQFHKSTILEILPTRPRHNIVQVDSLEISGTFLPRNMLSCKMNIQELPRQSIINHIDDLHAKLNEKSNQKMESQIFQSAQKENPGKSRPFMNENDSWIHQGDQGTIQIEKNAPFHEAREVMEQALVKAKSQLLQRDASVFSCVVYSLIGITASLSMSKAETTSVTHATPLIVATLLAGLYNCMVALAAVAGYRGLVSPGVSAWLPCLLGLFLGLFPFLCL